MLTDKRNSSFNIFLSLKQVLLRQLHKQQSIQKARIVYQFLQLLGANRFFQHPIFIHSCLVRDKKSAPSVTSQTAINPKTMDCLLFPPVTRSKTIFYPLLFIHSILVLRSYRLLLIFGA